jgi:hypothetical protein
MAAIATNPEHPWNSEWVGEAAAARITDSALLADVARTAGLWRVRLAAVAALKDESVLLDLAWNSGHTAPDRRLRPGSVGTPARDGEDGGHAGSRA